MGRNPVKCFLAMTCYCRSEFRATVAIFITPTQNQISAQPILKDR